MSDMPQHGVWESIYIGTGPYTGGAYHTICKVCYEDAPNHKPDCEFDALRQRLGAAEKERGWYAGLVARMEPHTVLRLVEGPTYATGDMDELAFFRGIVADMRAALAAGAVVGCSDETGTTHDTLTITDDYGNTWAATCECGGKMQVVRPGKVQCAECG